MGPDAVQLFYGSNRFMRYGTAPEPLQQALLGTVGVTRTVCICSATHMR